jgi:type I restriction enzyme S subunit
VDRATVPLGWKTFTLGELFEFSNGVNADKSAYGEGVPFVNVLEVISNEALTGEDIPGRIRLLPSLVARYQVQYGDVLLNRTSETQDEVGLTSVYLGDSPVVFGGFVFRARPKTNQLDAGYSKYALRVNDVREQIIARGQGGIRANVGQRDLKKVRVSLPPLKEQRTIAEALSDVDELIKSVRRLIVKKQAIKQGMMQQLLTGKSCLPGFTDQWPEATLGSIATVNMGQSPTGTSYNAARRGLPLVQGNADIKDRRTIDRLWTTQPTKRCRAGDVVLTVRAPVGYTAVASRDSCLGRGVCSVAAGLDNRFLFHALMYAEPRWGVFEQGSTFTAVNSNEVRSFTITWPCEPQERHAIASTLDDVDIEIAALHARLAKAHDVKQGMMQQLVTGRTRLPAKESVA